MKDNVDYIEPEYMKVKILDFILRSWELIRTPMWGLVNDWGSWIIGFPKSDIPFVTFLNRKMFL